VRAASVRRWLPEALLGAAVACVYAKHEARTRFTELQALVAERDRLEVEWGRLQIEQSAWSTPARVEQLARSRIGMVAPAPAQMRLLGE